MDGRRILAVACGLLLVLCARVCEAQDTDEAFLEQVRAAWEAREERVRSFVVDWVEQRTIPKGQDGIDRDGKPLPTKDTTFPIMHRMSCEGRRVRLTRSGVRFDIDHEKYVHKDYICVFDGDERRELFESEFNRKHPGGFLNRRRFFDDGTYLAIQPPLLLYRPLAGELGAIQLADWRMTPDRRSASGVLCRVVERTRGDGATDQAWIEDGGEFRVCRRQLSVKGTVFEDLSLNYAGKQQDEPLCRSWVHVTRDSGKVIQTNVVPQPLTQINVSVPESDFAYQFPVGTVVNYENENRYAVAREDGSLRPITGGEMAAGIPLETLMTTSPPPESEALDEEDRWTWLLVLLVATFVAASAVLKVRQRIHTGRVA